MPDSPFEMRFDPGTIKHLGVRMYATLPPAIAEIVANSYDADASEVIVTLNEANGKPTSIVVSDDGHGLTKDEINNKFLVIGRNRREDEGDNPSLKFDRKPIGKKGLGKLALFGLATRITICTCHNGKQNKFVLDWDKLNAARGQYKPDAIEIDIETDQPDGTVVSLEGLKRKSPFDAEGLADSLSRLFIVDPTFQLIIQTSKGDRIAIDNGRRYRSLNVQFEWDVADTIFVPENSAYAGKISGKLLTAKTPITPASGLRGVTLFSRQKLVNAPEFFSSSTSSNFYQYLTGWINVDFIDDIEEDVISTNRQSLDWEHPETANLRKFLSGIIAQTNAEWRRKRKEEKQRELSETTGIDTDAWLSTMPDDVKNTTKSIIDSLGGEDSLEKYTPVIKALHELVPEYPLLHWRHLHDGLKERVRTYYEQGQFGEAASQATLIYCDIIRNLTGRTDDGRSLVDSVFTYRPNSTPPQLPQLQLGSLQTESDYNIQEGQSHLSRGLVTGFRNPIMHRPMDNMVPTIFSELDCLNILSLVSYLITRLDSATTNSTP